MVTAELALSIVSALALLTMLSWGIYLLVVQLRCIDTASEVARQAARDDRAGVARAQREAPAGARISVRRSGDTAIVEVRVEARPLARRLPPVPLRARAEVALEPAGPRE